ncbi:MAG: hypothetical protein Q9201_005308 [Fulgogasparrea decipioides]
MESGKVSGLQEELAQTRKEIEKLETEKLLQGDEIRALKAEARSYEDEVRLLNDKIQRLEEQTLLETPAKMIGKEVRLRYLERHRQRIGRSIGKLGYERIKCGDRAAHRGRPVVDAWLCLTGLMPDREVYKDLYGVDLESMEQWKHVPEMIEITGFRASLQSEGRLTADFQVLFERLIEVAKTYFSSVDLRAAFGDNKTLQKLQGEMQNSYDEIVAANLRGRQGFSSQHSSQAST